MKKRISDFKDSRELKALKKRLAVVDGRQNPCIVKHDSTITNTSVINGEVVLNFGSYNYLCISGHPDTVAKAKEAIDLYGTSASGSRVLAGEKSLYLELEDEIADWKETEDAIVFVSGNFTNTTVIGSLMNTNDLILYDRFCHNSIQQGCKLSYAKSMTFPHNDFEKLEELLVEHRDNYEKVLIIIEGVYSMDGDIAPVPEFIRLKKAYGSMIMVDEAHSAGVLGITGKGVDEYFSLDPKDIDLKMGTLSKGIGSCGGYIAGSVELIEYLRFFAPGYVFAAGMSPSVAAAALEGIRVIRRENDRVKRLQNVIEKFNNKAIELGLNTLNSKGTPIIPVFIGDGIKAVDISNELLTYGIFVPPAVVPAVPKGEARLRFCVTCDHTFAQVDYALEKVVEVMGNYGVRHPDSD